MRFSRLLAVIAALFVVGGCRPSRRAPTPTLAILTWADYLGPTTVRTFTSRTGVRVTVDYIDSNEALIRRVESQPGQYDLIFPSAYAVRQMSERGLLRAIDRRRLGNISNLSPRFRVIADDPAGSLAVPYTVSFAGIAVNRARVQRPVSGYGIFFEAGMDGSALLLDDMRATLGMALKFRGFSANSLRADEILQAQSSLRSARSNVRVFASSDLQQTLASGEIGVALAWSGEILQAARLNPNLRLVEPQEGALIYIDCMAIPRSARHPADALRFIDHLLDGRVAAEISNEILYELPNTAAAPLLNPEARRLHDMISGLMRNPRAEQVAFVGDAGRLYAQAWSALRAQ